jgi:hypothetical protein
MDPYTRICFDAPPFNHEGLHTETSDEHIETEEAVMEAYNRWLNIHGNVDEKYVAFNTIVSVSLALFPEHFILHSCIGLPSGVKITSSGSFVHYPVSQVVHRYTLHNHGSAFGSSIPLTF